VSNAKRSAAVIRFCFRSHLPGDESVIASSQNRAHVYRHRAVAGVKWTTLSTALSTACYLLQTVVLARLLEPRDFGLMAMAAVVISIAMAYVDMGLSSAIVQRQHCSENELSSLYWLNVFAGLLVCGAILAISPLIGHFYREPRVTRIVQLCSLTFVIAPIGQQYQLLLQKELLFRPLALIEVVGRSVGTTVAIGLALGGSGVYSLVFGQLAASACSSLLLMLRGHRIYKPRVHFAWADVRSYMGFGLYQMGERAINTVHDNLDKLIIGAWLHAEALGLYNFAWNLATLPINRINPILTRTAFPFFSRLQDDSALLSRGYFKLLRMLSIVNFPLFLGLCGVSTLAVPAIFGDKWIPAVPLVQVFCLFAVGYSIGNPIGSLVLAKGRADLGFWWNVGISAIQAIAVALAAWRGGVMGVAVTLLVLQILYFPASYYFLVRPVIGPCWRRYVASVTPALISALIMLGTLKAILWLFPALTHARYAGLALMVVLGALVYLLAALLLLRNDLRDLVALILRRQPSEDRPAQETASYAASGENNRVVLGGAGGQACPDGK
jgi:O-antigen/teichoic acid export membrane protein